MVAVEPQSYYSAAQSCYNLSRDFQTAFNPLQTALLETGGMAGGYQAAKAWATSYDQRALAVVMAATDFARATQRLGDVFIACGYNWDWKNYAANRDPNKGAGPMRPSSIPTDLPYPPTAITGVVTSKKNGNGLETDYPELLEKATAKVAGGEIPDGNTDRLARAATAWRTFAAHDTVNNAANTLRTLQHVLSFLDAPDISNLNGHIDTLAKGVKEIQLASNDISKSVEAHNIALTAFRSEVNTQVTAIIVGSAISIGVIAVSIVGGTRAATAGASIESAATSIASLAGSFLSTLAGISFSAEAVSTAALVAITGLTLATVAGDDAQSKSPHTQPSQAADPAAKPSGTPETIRPQDDDETTRGKARENEAADVLARGGYEVEHGPKVAGDKNPDYRIEGEIFDAYSPSTDNVRNIGANIEKKVADGQTDRIVLNLADSNATPEAVGKQLRDWPVPGLKEVIVVDKAGNIVPIYP
ncbi:hypothetical protein [Aldersonia kunmingensis]|uniref:CdiA C-terminal domain-containing protein n=1 Tax=Aldersonia kunmingensis TaxID=408066 RepID=UPI00082B5839|nr:hypothetical protein [Aldersonia kunmingensis]